MVKKNCNFCKLQASYLFPEIQRRKQAYLQKHPEAQLISLGIGDTTQPIPTMVTQRLASAAIDLGTPEGYSGYGPEQGHPKLRQQIATRLYHDRMTPDEVFISDGAKCDIGRLQYLFDGNVTIAVQDPTYPVYVETSMLGNHNPTFVYMPCTPENDFFPDLDKTPPADIIYFCSPNNPTGTVATREQLQKLVDFAKTHRSIIIFDSAYSSFIQHPEIPRSIYEIEGARDVAIEIGSFSKMAGFTGVRLGWMVVPKTLSFDDNTSVHQSWNRVTTTFFNGASTIAQMGGLAALENIGQQEAQNTIHTYLQNARLIKKTFSELGFPSFGGVHSPYVWVNFHPKQSWEIFDELLENAQIVSTPGCGFGPSGEGYVRFSAFGSRQDTKQACQKLQNFFLT